MPSEALEHRERLFQFGVAELHGQEAAGFVGTVPHPAIEDERREHRVDTLPFICRKREPRFGGEAAFCPAHVVQRFDRKAAAIINSRLTILDEPLDIAETSTEHIEQRGKEIAARHVLTALDTIDRRAGDLPAKVCT
jgi:hypothetical protein